MVMSAPRMKAGLNTLEDEAGESVGADASRDDPRSFAGAESPSAPSLAGTSAGLFHPASGRTSPELLALELPPLPVLPPVLPELSPARLEDPPAVWPALWLPPTPLVPPWLPPPFPPLALWLLPPLSPPLPVLALALDPPCERPPLEPPDEDWPLPEPQPNTSMVIGRVQKRVDRA